MMFQVPVKVLCKVCFYPIYYMLVCVDALHSSKQFFSHVGTISCLPGLSQYTKQRIKCPAQGHNTVPSESLKLVTL